MMERTQCETMFMGRCNRLPPFTGFGPPFPGSATLVKFESHSVPDVSRSCNLVSKMEPISLLLVDAVFYPLTIQHEMGTS